VRLDHLLSKERLSTVRGRQSVRCETIPVGALVGLSCKPFEVAGIRSLSRAWTTVATVFSSVLRELATAHLSDAAASSRPSRSNTRVCELRMRHTSHLENCRASTSILFFPSYKEPTVDALAPRTDEGRE
jgi:hypothetical protein